MNVQKFLDYINDQDLGTKIMFVFVVISIFSLPLLITAGQTYVGIVTGLVAWLITYVFSNYLEYNRRKEREDKIDKCLKEISETQGLIKNH